MASFTAENPLKLYYFDIPGKGEPIRLACAYGGLPLVDMRLSGEEFEAMKADGKLPFNQFPVIELPDGRILAQSAAILRFIGKHTGLYPTDDHVTAAIIDSLLDEEVDLFWGLTVSRYKGRYGFAALDDAMNAQVRKSLNDEVLPRHLRYLEQFLERSTTGWIAGTEGPSIVEFMLVPRLKWLVTPGVHDGISTELLDTFPRLKDMILRFDNLPAIQNYYAARK